MNEVVFVPLENVKNADYSQISKIDFISGLITNGRLVGATTSSVGTSSFYTIPAGYTYFLISACLSMRSVSAGFDSNGVLYVDSVATGRILEICKSKCNEVETGYMPTETVSLSLSIPAKLESGQKLILEMNNGAAGYVNILGYLIPTSFLPNLI